MYMKFKGVINNMFNFNISKSLSVVSGQTRLLLFASLVILMSNFLIAQDSTSGLHPMKQTKLGLYVTAKEAYEMWLANPEKVKILDVRMPEEYVFVGHPAMAYNIPLVFGTYEWDTEKKMYKLKPNPDFVKECQALFQPDDIILATCRSGGRGAMAVNTLAGAGFTNVYNITDGIEGDEVTEPGSLFKGQRLVNGWKNSGIPWTYDVNPDLMKLPKN